MRHTKTPTSTVVLQPPNLISDYRKILSPLQVHRVYVHYIQVVLQPPNMIVIGEGPNS